MQEFFIKNLCIFKKIFISGNKNGKISKTRAKCTKKFFGKNDNEESFGV